MIITENGCSDPNKLEDTHKVEYHKVILPGSYSLLWTDKLSIQLKIKITCAQQLKHKQLYYNTVID